MNKYYLRAKRRKNDRQRITHLFRIVAEHRDPGESPVAFLRRVLKVSKRPGRRYTKGFRGRVIAQVRHATPRINAMRITPCPA